MAFARIAPFCVVFIPVTSLARLTNRSTYYSAFTQENACVSAMSGGIVLTSDAICRPTYNIFWVSPYNAEYIQRVTRGGLR